MPAVPEVSHLLPFGTSSTRAGGQDDVRSNQLPQIIGERVSGCFGFPAPKGPGPGGHYFEFGKVRNTSLLVQSYRFSGNEYLPWL